MALLSGKARSEHGSYSRHPRATDGFAGATATHIGKPPATGKEQPEGTTVEQRHRKLGVPGWKGRPDKDAMGGRAKAADFDARSRAGAMLRLSRVMKNR